MTAPPILFDRKLYARRRARAAAMAADRFLVREAAEGLADRRSAINRRFTSALELGARRDSAALLAPLAEQWTRLALSQAEGGNVLGDEEALPFAAGSFDLVVSVLGLHALNDLPGALAQIRRVLKPDGLFLAALFGGETLGELRTALGQAESLLYDGISPRVSPFADVRSLGALLQRAGFALPVADLERTRATYPDLNRLACDLRAMGEANCLAERRIAPAGRGFFAAAEAAWRAQSAGAGGRLPATFDIIYLAGWAPHDSQQRPLKPGSATARLADALGTAERPAEP